MEIVPPNFQTAAAVLPTQQAVTHALPQIQAQAAMPNVARAVDPAPKSQNAQTVRSQADKAKGGDRAADGRQRGGSVVDVKV